MGRLGPLSVPEGRETGRFAAGAEAGFAFAGDAELAGFGSRASASVGRVTGFGGKWRGLNNRTKRQSPKHANPAALVRKKSRRRSGTMAKNFLETREDATRPRIGSRREGREISGGNDELSGIADGTPVDGEDPARAETAEAGGPASGGVTAEGIATPMVIFAGTAVDSGTRFAPECGPKIRIVSSPNSADHFSGLPSAIKSSLAD